MFVESACTVDIVVDTNILEHSINSGLQQHSSALAVIAWLAANASVYWVLDDQGKAAPDLSTSLLASEYFRRLAPQSLPLVVLTHYLQHGRVRFSGRPDHATQRALRRMLPRNSCDRAVIGAAIGAINKVLVSNDWQDFSETVRRAAAVDYGVTVIDSIEAAA